MKSITCTVLESYVYDNVLVIKYFCTTTNFSYTYVCTNNDLSNPALFRYFPKKQGLYYDQTPYIYAKRWTLTCLWGNKSATEIISSNCFR